MTRPSSDPALAPLRLDIRSLPSLATLEAGMIVALVTGALVLIQLALPSQPTWLLLILYGFVALRAFFHAPERMARRFDLHPPPDEILPLQLRIDELAAGLALPRSPTLVVSPDDAGLATFGTLRRWFLWCGEGRARQLALRAEKGDEELDAALLHELCHLQQGDHLRIGAAKAATVAGATVMLWAVIIGLGLLAFGYVIRDAIAESQPSEWIIRLLDSARAQGVRVPAISLTWIDTLAQADRIAQDLPEFSFRRRAWSMALKSLPITLLAGVLLAVSWRRLLRVREHYADVGAAANLGNGGAVVRALFTLGGGASSGRIRLPLAGPLLAWVTEAHPSAQERLRTLRDPGGLIARPWRAAASFGVFLLILELLLHGTSNMLALGWNPLREPVVAGVLLLGLHAVLRSAAGSYRLRETLGVAALALTPVALFRVLVTIGMLTWFAVWPESFRAFLDDAMLAAGGHSMRHSPGVVAHYAGPILAAQSLRMLATLPAGFALIVATVWLIVHQFRRLAACRPAAAGGRWVLRRFHGLLAVHVLFLWLAVAPIVGAVVMLDLSIVYSPFVWLGAFGAGVVWFGTMATAPVLLRRRPPLCPTCGAPLVDAPDAGACPSCGANSAEWPWTRYLVEAA